MHGDWMRVEESSKQRNALPIGMAKLTRLAFAGIDLGQIAGRLLGMFERDPNHAGALMDLSTIDQLNGNLVVGLKRQAMALSKQRVFHSTCCGANARLRVLAFVAAADLGANTPLEFLLEGSDIALTMAYVLPGRPLLPRDLPDHDLAFVAIAATASNRTVLAELEELLDWWPVPVINPPQLVSTLEPEELASNSSAIARLKMALGFPVRRDDLLTSLADGRRSQLPPPWRFPVAVKPYDAPDNLRAEKIESGAQLGRYLSTRCEKLFAISPFVDCRSGDGLFRKFRIFFIDRRPYACHLAVSEAWNTAYFETRMDASEQRRREEERFFANFDADFAARHGATFAALVDHVGLTYFGIDCAETSSGELVVFKADHTLLVHDMDPVDIFPYRPAQMRKIFDAFSSYLYRAAKEHGADRRSNSSGGRSALR